MYIRSGPSFWNKFTDSIDRLGLAMLAFLRKDPPRPSPDFIPRYFPALGCFTITSVVQTARI
jgi:hypothetical protein